MSLLKKVIITSLIAINSNSFAGIIGPAVTNPPRLYTGIQVGDSISANTHFQPRIRFPGSEPLVFSTPTNTDWTRDFGSEIFVGGFIGYNWNSNLAFQFSYDYRDGYDWSVLATENDSLFAPDVYDRYNVKSTKIQTFLFDMVLRPTVEWGGFVPYVKGGIGVASNRIKGMQNIDEPIRGRPLTFNSTITGKTTTNFAWDAGVGVDYFVNEKFSLGLGYRIVDVGSLKSGNRLFDTISLTNNNITPFQTKHVFLNEVSVSAAYHFDYA